jgi:nucleoside-triphosphatase THEP1
MEDKGSFRAPRIAAIATEHGVSQQTLLLEFAERRRAQGLRVAGVVEVVEPSGRGACKARLALDLATGARFVLSQELGSGSTACNLDLRGLAQACAATQRAIDGGADLVILSKFGKIEAERGGFCDAFASAIAAELQIVTTVSSELREAWARFAGSLADDVEASAESLESWWRAQRRSPSIRQWALTC